VKEETGIEHEETVNTNSQRAALIQERPRIKRGKGKNA
jgi:hypothetical protein